MFTANTLGFQHSCKLNNVITSAKMRKQHVLDSGSLFGERMSLVLFQMAYALIFKMIFQRRLQHLALLPGQILAAIAVDDKIYVWVERESVEA